MRAAISLVLAHFRSNAVGYLALVVAMSGTAYAATSLPANSVGTRQLKRGAVTLSKVSSGAERALRGQQGPPGTALAYAHVFANGTLDPARSRNIVGVTEPDPGIYCFSLSFTPESAVATLENAATPPNIPPAAFLYTNVGTAPQACPAGSEAGVVMRDVNGLTVPGAAFFVVFN